MSGQNTEFRCKRDGLTIRGRIYGDTASPKPVAILCHGFLANQKMCRRYAGLLADIGYVSVTFDFCGGGLGCKSDGKSEDMTVLSEVSDLFAVIEHIKKEPYTKGISLLGCSQGGFVSAMAAKKLPGQIDKLVLMYPALCIPDDARKGKMLSYEFDPKNIPALLGRFPMKLGGNYARAVIDMDPFEEIGGFDGPVLYLHGTEDDIVDIDYARKAKGLYSHCEYHEIAGGGHVFRGKSDEEACRLLAGFMGADI